MIVHLFLSFLSVLQDLGLALDLTDYLHYFAILPDSVGLRVGLSSVGPVPALGYPYFLTALNLLRLNYLILAESPAAALAFLLILRVLVAFWPPVRHLAWHSYLRGQSARRT